MNLCIVQSFSVRKEINKTRKWRHPYWLTLSHPKNYSDPYLWSWNVNSSEIFLQSTLPPSQAESWYLQRSSYSADTHISATCISSHLVFICSEMTHIHVDNNSAVLHFCITHVVMITLCWSSQMSTIKRLWTDTRLKQIQYYFDATPRVLPGSKSYWNKNIAPYVTSKIQIAHDGIRHVIKFTVQVHNRHIQFCMLNGQCGALREPLQN